MAGASSYGAVGRGPLAAAALAAAREASVPVGVHLDHCRDEAEVDACLALGYSSVMIDGSHLAFEENVALTRRVVERAHAAGAWVEAELGALPGDEDRSGDATPAGDMTDPAEAAEFAQRTGVDALAVAVGNVHGFTPEPVRLDLARLREIAAACSAPLVLHGASGLPAEDLVGAVAAGVVKVNVNAELRRAHLEALVAGLGEVGDDVRALQTLAIDAMARVAEDKIALLARI
jgi:fructose-bisphosphate aldolase class II/tagatose 1,6-diphosphate aldolase GatY/KbaY